jgi:hypothetical protein
LRPENRRKGVADQQIGDGVPLASLIAKTSEEEPMAEGRQKKVNYSREDRNA